MIRRNWRKSGPLSISEAYSLGQVIFDSPEKEPPVSKEALTGYLNSGYRGFQNMTKSGLQCQKWTAQSPQKHSVAQSKSKGIGNHNFCRNPNPASKSSKDIWCYTQNRRKRWEYCVPLPDAPVVEEGDIQPFYDSKSLKQMKHQNTK